MARRSKKSAKRRLRGLVLVTVVIVAVVAFRLAVEIGHEPSTLSTLTVVRVIDGDTVELSNGEKLRLLGIDTPERAEPYYDEARALLARLVGGEPVTIEYAARRRDKYGRLLGYLYLDDTLLVNRVLLDSGLAYVYLFRDTDAGTGVTAALLSAQRSAIDRGAGFYTIPRTPEPEYIARRTSYRFHRPACPTLQSLNPGTSRSFPTREDALYEGLSPCRRCKP